MILVGDCVEQMRTLEAESVDAIITDPPYGLEFMGKDWDSLKSHIGNPDLTNHSKELPQGGAIGVSFGAPKRNPWCRSCGKYKHAPHASKCFCKEPKWNTRQDEGGRQMQGWHEQWAKEAFRVLKPGGHLLAFGATRTYHRLAAGIEDAGFEIRDTLMWLYGSGFPKSLDVSKAIDKAAGAQREVIGSRVLTGNGKTMKSGFHQPDGSGGGETVKADLHYLTAPSTEAAKKWDGWGTALKPAVEPIVLARKPLIGTVAENVLKHGTGALNIDASRIEIAAGDEPQAGKRTATFGTQQTVSGGDGSGGWTAASGRWPANILLDESAAAALDELSGGASRFFYVAKAGRAERNKGLDGFEEKDAPQKYGLGQGNDARQTPHKNAARANIHPTVKPVALMRYLIRLVAHKDAVILDPFLGSGTTAVAAIEEGVQWIGCEREPEYVEIIKARVAAAQPGLGLTLGEVES